MSKVCISPFCALSLTAPCPCKLPYFMLPEFLVHRPDATLSPISGKALSPLDLNWLLHTIFQSFSSERKCTIVMEGLFCSSVSQIFHFFLLSLILEVQVNLEKTQCQDNLFSHTQPFCKVREEDTITPYFIINYLKTEKPNNLTKLLKNMSETQDEILVLWICLQIQILNTRKRITILQSVL